MAEALSAMHDAGIIHGDLRPDTVVVTPKGHAKLLDGGFGTFTTGGAQRAAASADPDALPLSSLPTIRYLSPEQALGGRVDARTDVFSLGAVLYEMFTGRPPFDAASTGDVIIGVLQETPQRPSERAPNVPLELDRLTSRALAKSLDRRYQTARAFAADLRAMKAGLETRRETLVESSEDRRPKRRPAWMFVSALVLLIILAAAWWQRDALLALF
jgi:eukaryotic-like serine/threonine-protein kinase